MDRLHHDLFSALDTLSGSEDAVFCKEFTTFVGHMEHAFREEETWMDELDFNEMAEHQEQHARVLGALHHIHAQVMSGDVGIGRHVVDELLPQWLLLHISTMDTSVALAMQLARSEGAPFLQPS
jgi:hemerythrin-like metal-binding protein